MGKNCYQLKIKAIVFDWAGTTVDYGCFAPTDAFVETFKKRNIPISIQEVRAFMGLHKRDHIKAICNMESIADLWKYQYGNKPTEKDIDDLNNNFEEILFEVLSDYTDPIPGVLKVVESLKKRGIKIGSTTGYTRKMMDIVVPNAKRKGYMPDVVVTPTDVPGGRPFPWMCYQNAINLQVFPLKSIVKVGDTVNDIKEGINAGMWSVGVIYGGNELGLTESETSIMHKEILEKKNKEISQKFYQAGADYVINTIEELEGVILDIEQSSLAIHKDFPYHLEGINNDFPKSLKRKL